MSKHELYPFFDAWGLATLVTTMYLYAMHEDPILLPERVFFIAIGCFTSCVFQKLWNWRSE
jgi:hypothetical protein